MISPTVLFPIADLALVVATIVVFLILRKKYGYAFPTTWQIVLFVMCGTVLELIVISNLVDPWLR
jgi:hypothetical protein